MLTPIVRPPRVRLPWFSSLFLLFVFAIASWHLSLGWNWTMVPSATQLEASVSTGSDAREIALLVLGMYAIVSIVRLRQWPLRPSGLAGLALLSYIAMACASVAWTVDQALTIRAVARLLLMSAAAIAIAQSLTLRQITKLAFCVSAATLAVSTIIEADRGLHVVNAGWRFAGVMHPVSQAWNCSILVLAGYHLSRSSYRHRALFRFGASTGLVFLALTKSRAAFIGTLLAMAMCWYSTRTRSARASRRILALAVAAGLAGVLLIVTVSEPGSSLLAFGRGSEGVASVSTLTGRLPLWQACIDYAVRRPWLGYGYNSFLSPQLLLAVPDSSGWMSSPHSGYIGTFLELGAVGVVLLCLTLLLCIRRSFRILGAQPDQSFTLSVLVWFAVNLGSESLLFTNVAFSSLLVLILIYKCCVVGPSASSSWSTPHDSRRLPPRSQASHPERGIDGHY